MVVVVIEDSMRPELNNTIFATSTPFYHPTRAQLVSKFNC